MCYGHAHLLQVLHAVIMGSAIIVEEIGDVPRWYLFTKLANESTIISTSQYYNKEPLR